MRLGYADVIFRRRESRQPEIRLRSQAISPVVKIKKFLLVICSVVKIKQFLVVICSVVKMKQFLVVISPVVKIKQF